MKDYNVHELQDKAHEFLKDSNLQESQVKHKEGYPVLLIHLLTDFYKHLKE